MIEAHGFTYNKRAHFEMLHGHMINLRGKFKNPYFQQIMRERNITQEQAQFIKEENPEFYGDLLIESIQRAETDSRETSSLLFFKANVGHHVRFNLFERIDKELDSVSYAGFYRANQLDRCICMIRDCFWESSSYGKAVFASNGTESDLCFRRRFNEGIKTQAKFTDVSGCLRHDERRIALVKGWGYESFSLETLFQFETSNEEAVMDDSVDLWMKFLRPLLKDEMVRSIVVSVLEEGWGTRMNESSQSSRVYNYDQVVDKLKGEEQWEIFIQK